ncbi:MAG: hypothetical protein ACI9MR_002657 [Myxococcota bacterium]|jgi:hypothetical protein
MTLTPFKAASRLALVAASALVLTAAAGSTSLAADFGPLMKYVPSDATVIIALDLQEMGKSSLFKTMRDDVLGKNSKKVKDLAKATGFDAKKDVHQIVLAGTDKMLRSGKLILIARGNFDAQKFLDYGVKANKPLKAMGPPGKVWYAVDQIGALAFDGNIAVASPKKLMDGLLATQSGPSGTMNKLIQKFASHKAGFAVMRPSGKTKKQGAEFVDALGELTGAGIGINLGSGLDLSIVADFASAASATSFAAMITETVGGAAEDAKELGLENALTNLKAAAAGTATTISLALTEAEVKNAVELVNE